jgi:ribosomal protein S18 acetylase RimI-like enzyme
VGEAKRVIGDNISDNDHHIHIVFDGNVDGLNITRVEQGLPLDNIKELFVEYAGSLDFDLKFQNFKDELAQLPGEYAPPEGCLFIAFYGDKPVGCVGLRKLEKNICEMKRLYVRPKYRARGVGKFLAKLIIQEACNKGYARMRLDTVPAMKRARKLYYALGFKKIQPYCYNPIEGAVFMEKNLTLGN